MHKKLEAMEGNSFDAISSPHPVARTAKRLRIPVIPTIAAAIFGIVMLGASALPASAASTTVATTAHSSAQTAPLPWYYYASYPTYSACRYAGINKIVSGAALSFQCHEYTVGDYFIWKLFLYS